MAKARGPTLGRCAAYGAVLLAACSQASPLPEDPRDPSVFVASAEDFTGFRDWEGFAITADVAPGDSHLNGPRHVFLNHPPPPGSKKFPVGTIIVKQTDPGALEDRTVFAMVKRGGGYDPTGARDWEWFSLANMTNGAESIVWRGPGPAGGGAYGSGPLGGCNACHESAASTDYVLTSELEQMLGGGDDPI